MPKAAAIRTAVELAVDDSEPVPAIMQQPRDAAPPVPGVLLLHGFSSRKERMADSIGRALARRGVATLAIDLPLHGAREGGIEGLSLRHPLALVQKWTLAVREAHAGIQYLAEHREVDPRRVAVAGYSLGAYLAVAVAAKNRLIDAIALAAGGDLPAQTPFAAIVRTVADPLRAVRALDGRPLLMVNGRYDRTVRPEQAQRLYDAANEPKELRWYEGGHWPPTEVIEDVSAWLTDKLSS